MAKERTILRRCYLGYVADRRRRNLSLSSLCLHFLVDLVDLFFETGRPRLISHSYGQTPVPSGPQREHRVSVFCFLWVCTVILNIPCVQHDHDRSLLLLGKSFLDWTQWGAALAMRNVSLVVLLLQFTCATGHWFVHQKSCPEAQTLHCGSVKKSLWDLSSLCTNYRFLLFWMACSLVAVPLWHHFLKHPSCAGVWRARKSKLHVILVTKIQVWFVWQSTQKLYMRKDI